MEGYGIMKDAEIVGDVAMDPVRMYGIMLRQYHTFSLPLKEACETRSFAKIKIPTDTRYSVLSYPFELLTIPFILLQMVSWVE